jgi:hypothetical protein
MTKECCCIWYSCSKDQDGKIVVKDKDMRECNFTVDTAADLRLCREKVEEIYLQSLKPKNVS